MSPVYLLLAGDDELSLEVLGTFLTSRDAQSAFREHRLRYRFFVLQQIRLPPTAYDSRVGRAAQLVGRVP
jgi:hypothetical protein